MAPQSGASETGSVEPKPPSFIPLIFGCSLVGSVDSHVTFDPRKLYPTGSVQRGGAIPRPSNA